MDVVYSEDCLLHDPLSEYSCGQITSYGESPQRLTSIKIAMESQPDRFRIITANDYTLAPILSVHHQEYIQFLHSIHNDWVSSGLGDENCPVTSEIFAHHSMLVDPNSKNAIPNLAAPRARVGKYTFDMSTTYTKDTWRSTYAAAQVTLTAAHRLLEKHNASLSSSTATGVYALCRPPGHHAACQVAGGYCFINNAAIAARFIQNFTLEEMNTMATPFNFDFDASTIMSFTEKNSTTTSVTLEKKKIMIVDIDYHHGNGTQSIFYDDPSVLYISLHGYPSYPYYTGATNEDGTGAGKGYNINVCLDPITTTDEAYLSALQTTLQKNTYAHQFDADVVICSMGLDTWHENAGAGFKGVTDVHTYFKIGQLFKTVESCKGRPVLFVQEGGTTVEKLGCLATKLLSGYCSE
ncbi:hypothetical protein BDA99DRAFT_482632 [Phascolomyces articulosus]|uniref:Histone deacetylase domain-containing protein n=1 Tax=Phascolomyces articulosus TaxID=60185 RepID=A0AAD5PEX9_9FUNG|nr:hypothetical protein BDA99DRAFT_482632 [Phascolomyces articulosus]